MPGNNENPTTKFKVDISELKAGIQESNRLIKLANSEFKAAASGMDNWADSTDGLEAKIKQLTTVQAEEEKKLANLQEQYRKTAEAEGENSKGAQELAIKINNQQAAVNKVSSKLSGYEDRLDLVKRAQANAEKSGNSLEDELRALESAADDAGDAAEESADGGFTILKGTLADLASSAIQGAISAVGDLVGSLMELPEATKEFRTLMGAVEQSAADSAIGVDGAKKAYEEFYAVAADEGQAGEATTHLNGLVAADKDLQGAIDGVMGAWVEFQDSISIEGLAEAAHETASVGSVTGQFADALNWATASGEDWEKALSGNEKALSAFKKATNEGMSAEDAYNEALSACSTEQQRQQLVVATLNQLYGENARAYKESNSSILDTNTANLKLLESQSELATAMEPLTAAWTNFKSQALEAITPLITVAADKFKEAITYFQENETAANALKATMIGLAAALGIVGTAFLISNVISAVQKAMALLNTTMLLNPFVLVAAAVAGLVAAFIYLWNTSDEFREFFVNLWETIKKSAGDAIDAIVGFFKKLPGRVSEWFTNTVNKAKEFGSNLKAKATAAGTNFLNSIISFIKQLPGKIWSLFLQAVQKVVDFKSQLTAKGKEAAQGLWDSIVNKIKKLPGEIKGIGSDIIKGLWNGINDMASWIGGKIDGFGENVLNGIKDFFGINSPSKVMKEQIGKNLVKGIAAGITENKKTATSVIKKFGEELLSTLEKRLSNYKVYHTMSLQEEVDYWNNARKLFKKGTQDRIDADAKYYEAKKAFSEKRKEINEKAKSAEAEYTKSVAEAYTSLSEKITAALDDYRTAVENRTNSITGSLSLFSEFTKNVELTGTDLIANLQSQVTGLQTWMDTLDKLGERCTNSEFIQYLREMGPSAAGEVEALNRLSDDKLNEYVSLWESKNDLARQAAEKELTDLQNETINKIASLVSETKESIKGYKKTYDDALKELGVSVKKHVEDADDTLVKTAAKTIIKSAPSVGENTVNGIIQGLNNRAGALYSTISGIISEAIAQAAAAADINSPSEIMRKFIGQNLIKGVELGINEEARGLYSSMRGTISNAIESAKGGLNIAGNAGNLRGTINNYTFNQTNNSPKALSRIDIYRQTRNQFRQLQEV